MSDEGLHQIPVEIKSGQTITSNWLKSLKYWQTLQPQSPGGIVYYGGEEEQERSGGYFFRSWRGLAEVEE